MNNISPNTRGAIFMLLTMAGYVLNDMFVKLTLAELNLFQSIFIRGIFAFTLLIPLAWWMGAFKSENGTLASLKHPMVFWRVLGETAGTFFFLTALKHMPIGNITAILQTLPLTITLSAALFLGETVGWRRYVAIFIGFFGVLLIIKPGTEGFDIFAIYALIATGFITLRDIATRQIPDTTPTLLVSLLTAFAILALGGIGSLFQPWVEMQPIHLIYLFSAACAITIGYVFSILTMRHGEVSFIAMFRYSSLIWALLIGYFVFGEIPDSIAMLGAIIVVGSGLFTFYRERQINRGGAD